MKGMACCYPAFMAAALLVLSGAAGAVVEVKFSELDPEAAGQVVLFYRNGDSASDDARAALAAAETTVKASVGAKADDVVFKLCDAAQKDNMVGMEAKGLTALPMLFVAIEDRYMRNMTAEGIAEYLTVKLAETTEDDVFPFNTELLKDEFPVFVKFYENWCSRCQQMKSAFEYAASKTLGRVMFMEVECSSSGEARAFCGKERVDGFPTLKLVGGPIKKSITHDGDRSALGMLSFIQSHVPDALDPLE